MTKIVLCYGIILGLYCLVHGVYGSEDLTSKHSNAKHRQSGYGYSESGIAKDKIFIKSETPLRGRKIHQSAWSKEEVTENSPEEFKTANSSESRDSWNFDKIYSYLLPLIYKTDEMEQAKMTSSETVEMIRNKIKSEIKARSNPHSGKTGTGASESSESRRLTDKADYVISFLDRRLENSESSEESEESNEYESCEDEDSSSEMYDDRKSKGKTHKDKKENGSEVVDCYEESDENISLEKETGSNVKKEETAEERQQSSLSEHKRTQLSGQVTTLNEKNVKDNRKSFNILRRTTGAAGTESTPKFMEATSKIINTAKMNKDGNVESNTGMGITPTASSYVHEPTIVNLPTKSTDQFILSSPDVQDQVNFNMVTESNAQVTPTKSASTAPNGNSVLLQKILNPATPTTLKGLVTDSKKGTEILPQDNFEVIITAPEFIPISQKVGITEVSSSKNNEVKPNINEILSLPVDVAHVYGGQQSESQRVDKSETEVSNQRKLQNQVAKETKSETSMSDSIVFTQDNMENNQFQQESISNYGRKDDILEEYNLKNEFIEINDNNKMEFMNMLNDYSTNLKYAEESKHSSMSKNAEFNEENTNQETFDTILEFLYKHSKNPLILSLRNSNKTLF